MASGRRFKDVNLGALLAGALLFYGTAVQIGFFRSIGIEFISFVGVRDWLYSVVFLLPLILLSFPLGVAAYKLVSSEALEDDWYGGRMHKLGILLDGWIGLLAAFSIIVLLSVLDVPEYVESIIIAALLFYISLIYGAGIFRDYVIEADIVGLKVAVFMLTSGVFVAHVSESYVDYFAGRNCVILRADNLTEQVTFLRSVGSGYLFIDGNYAEFRRQDAVKKLECRYSRKSSAERAAETERKSNSAP